MWLENCSASLDQPRPLNVKHTFWSKLRCGGLMKNTFTWLMEMRASHLVIATWDILFFDKLVLYVENVLPFDLSMEVEALFLPRVLFSFIKSSLKWNHLEFAPAVAIWTVLMRDQVTCSYTSIQIVLRCECTLGIECNEHTICRQMFSAEVLHLFWMHHQSLKANLIVPCKTGVHQCSNYSSFIWPMITRVSMGGIVEPTTTHYRINLSVLEQ